MRVGLMAGDFRDPLVGRDVLVGVGFGFGYILCFYLADLVPKWLGYAPGVPWLDFPAVPALLIALALACCGFHTSLAGQKLFRGDILEG